MLRTSARVSRISLRRTHQESGDQAIEENKSKYTPAGGIMPLREAIWCVAQSANSARPTNRKNVW